MLPASLSLHDLLCVLERERLVRSSPGEVVQIETLLGARDDWTRDSLAAALASVLASDRERWRAIHDRVRELIDPSAPSARRSSTGFAERLDESPAGPGRPPPCMLASGMVGQSNPRIRVWATLGAVAVLVFLGTLIARHCGNEPGQMERLDAGVVVAGTVADLSGAGANGEEKVLDRGSRPVDWARFGAVWPILAGLGVLALLLALWSVRCIFAMRHDRSAHAALRQRALSRRAKALRRARAGEALHEVERTPPFAEAAMDDAASLLARAGNRARGLALDIPATVERAARSAGLFEPVLADTLQGQGLVVLVDVEKERHPCLDGVEWVLQRWRRTGLRLVRYDFHYAPERLWPAAGGPSLSLEALGRRSAGAPLLLFSRLRSSRTSRGPGWPGLLTPWPARALIDLHPCPDERSYDGNNALCACAGSGLASFSFTPRGLVAAASTVVAAHRVASRNDTIGSGWFRAALVAGRNAGRPSLLPLEVIEKDIRTWATCAAYVPNPTWSQLESMRRHFPDLARALPEPGYVQRLIEWVNGRDPDRDAEGHDGARLDLSMQLQNALIAAQRHADRGMPLEQRLEYRVRMLLVEQLRRQPAAASRVRSHTGLLSELHSAFHRTVLDPELVPDLLTWFGSTAVRPELGNMLRQEMAIQSQHRAVLVPWSSSARESARALLRRRSSRWRLLWPWSRPAGQSRPALAMATTTAAVALWLVAILPVLTSPEPEAAKLPTGIRRAIEPRSALLSSLPPIDAGARFVDARLEPVPADDAGVELSPFDARSSRSASEGGAANARGDQPDAIQPDTPLEILDASTPAIRDELALDASSASISREGEIGVRILRLEVAATEVTQGTWRELMGTTPVLCEYGCGDDYPMVYVALLEVVKLLNRLSQKEQKPLCYDIQGRDFHLRPGCSGYRLPTAEEWLLLHSQGGYVGRLDKYAWYKDNSGLRLHVVAELRKDASGLHDLLGNVSEWVHSSTGPMVCGGHFRGESVFLREPHLCRRVTSPRRAGTVGFRWVRDLPP